ncbi:1,6-dihydroxycyclohexa-2,4-diene-1-carboxylate dehydrogenase [Mycolicibacterium smegmatis]|uniref:benzoate 1,2-dioxygenase electron transfer component BenC n=1 Tax=Mycolicibacterium smegmatis TaxID=1772 RepID=UPI0005D9179D|nr:benzoate 1,2-dioxygenase electron transfer component BenC [Mycolicibacterium smegmatis]MDF1901348.1 benzoate 1,2-dioxygenase electron transfer component BenC [Mycolicibacterium smegmatis]MDF1907611.1 benzoate 1,2-dioxygenase electron transfer component BenC [Mycolicibacterium smegmatis]MDF1920395.1 benzoate 1,2-dioxygenase electron transfer component BenC [Mycolicibacterium smegmatis]MDF1926149.1 benzoate 1,2-dioxygenase electron transfer component BenC [Mycolicibacterium smegmatis]UGT77251
MTVMIDRNSAQHPNTPEGDETFSVALSFEDGVTRFITCRADQTVADASYRQRINIPLDCRDGACGTCKALCESGRYDAGTYIDDALAPDEAERGYVLPCSMKPRSDLVLQIAGTSDIAKTQATRYTGTIVELTRLSATTVRFTVEIPDRADLAFLPGQYVNITVPGTDITRSYSFSNPPDEALLTFLVKLVPGGAMSEYLSRRAVVGDAVSFTGPHGSFFLREAERPILLLAGGTGLAPVLSMLGKLRSDGSTRTAHLIYGVSSDADLVELDRIDEFASQLPAFTWSHCVSDPSSTSANKVRIPELISSEHLYGGDVAVYLCGPPPMVEAVRTHLTNSGVTPTGFYFEKFGLTRAGAPDAPADRSPAEESAAGPVENLLTAPDADAICGQQIPSSIDMAPAEQTASRPGHDHADSARRIAGQLIAPAAPGTATQLDDDGGALRASGARSLAGQEVFAARAVAAPASVVEVPDDVPEPVHVQPPQPVAPDGYQIGEEHPELHESDALFEARQALELGALELTIGRLSTAQLAGYRLLAESTLPYVDGDRFVDAARYTETNAAFHDYLFTLTGNEHLLQAYQALDVKGRMSEVLRHATWCHPLCAQDHVRIVEAFEAHDRAAAKTLITAHAECAKQTMRRALADQEQAEREKVRAARTPRFISPGRFRGKVVVVTGAAQGIGEHTARRINAEDGRVVMVDRAELVHDLADELSQTGPATLAVTADLEHPDGAETVVRQAIRKFGHIDVLINNVGGAINFKPFTQFTADEIQAEITRSLMTTLYACRAALPAMVEQGHGVIVNVSSAATRGIHRIPYSAAKGGINAITASLAMEYADAGIRVVATAPGGTDAPPRRISRGTPAPADDTERAWFQAHIDQTLASSLMHRYGTLDEQAAAICFLASDEASYITGSVLPVAGGDLG